MKKEKWIEERKLKNKFEKIFKEISKDLYKILILYKYDGKNNSLNTLKLSLTATMDWHKDEIYKVKGKEN